MNKSNQNILGIYTYVDVLVDAIKKLRAEGFENLRVFSPVPNHEIEDALDTGKEPSKVKYFTFCGAILGALVGVCFTVLTSLDWPIVTSAKPIVSIPPYMIIIFECMILIGGLSTFLGLLINSRLRKDTPPELYDERFSDNKFGILVNCNSDDLEKDSDLKKFYDLEEMLKFVSDSLEVFPLYKWADPLGKNPYSVMHTDHYFPWHFDGNDFTLSVLIQKAEKGGLFEYVPDIRNKDNENFDEVAKVLKDDRARVKSLDLKPGDLQIFKGRFSMHRVTKIEGKTSRYIALPCYVKDPLKINKPEHSKQVYGKALPIHFKRENIQGDGLTD